MKKIDSLYRLSPSDFAYLWNNCKYCYYQKIKFGVVYSSPFPAMFGRISSLLQTSIMGKNFKDVNPNLPKGIIEIQEGFMKSKQIPETNTYLSGRFDVLSKLDDGSYAIIDFKITIPDTEKILKNYSMQLHAYKFALENPQMGKPIKISKMGVVSINPDEVRLVNGKVQFTATPAYHEVKEDMDSFLSLIKEVSSVLEGPLPAESETCSLCIYRRNLLGKLSTANIISLGESETIEFKSSFRWDYKLAKTTKIVEHAVLRAIASFLNHNGGTLCIGVADNGEILGLDKDFDSLNKKGKDGFELYLSQAINTAIGKEFRKFIHVAFEDTNKGTICIVKVEPSKREPAFIKNSDGVKEFYIRSGNASQALDIEETIAYIRTQWE